MFIENNLYGLMFDNLPALNPSIEKYATMLWDRHLKIYQMHEITIKPNTKLPQRAESGLTILEKSGGKTFMRRDGKRI